MRCSDTTQRIGLLNSAHLWSTPSSGGKVASHQRPVIVGKDTHDLRVKVSGRGDRCAAVSFVIGGAALLDVFTKDSVQIAILLALSYLGLVVELDLVDQ